MVPDWRLCQVYVSSVTTSARVGLTLNFTVAVLDLLLSDWREILSWKVNSVSVPTWGKVRVAVGCAAFWMLTDGDEGDVFVHSKTRLLASMPWAVLEPERKIWVPWRCAVEI
jgi:hypothetical protein